MAEKIKKTRKSKAAKAALVEKAVQADAVVDAAPTEPEEAAGASVAVPVAETADSLEATVTVDELVGVVTPPSVGPDSTLSADEAVAAAFAEEPVSAELKAIVEALIFASPEPLTVKALIKILDSEPREEVERAIAALKVDYRQVRGLHLVEVAGGLQIVTRPDLNEWVRRLFHERKSTRLSVQALETLAVIAYRQPVTAAEIAEIRGVNTSGVLSTLVERRLIKTAGRKAVVGRPFLYATTKEFLLRFGLNDVSDLPKVEDLADVLGFELPGLLNEGLPTDQLLPLGDPDEVVPTGAGAPAFETPGPLDASPTGDVASEGGLPEGAVPEAEVPRLAEPQDEESWAAEPPESGATDAPAPDPEE